jgi:hypothetical protein
VRTEKDLVPPFALFSSKAVSATATLLSLATEAVSTTATLPPLTAEAVKAALTTLLPCFVAIATVASTTATPRSNVSPLLPRHVALVTVFVAVVERAGLTAVLRPSVVHAEFAEELVGNVRLVLKTHPGSRPVLEAREHDVLRGAKLVSFVDVVTEKRGEGFANGEDVEGRENAGLERLIEGFEARGDGRGDGEGASGEARGVASTGRARFGGKDGRRSESGGAGRSCKASAECR